MSENMETATPKEVAELTAEVVAAYVSNNPVQTNDLPDLIADVRSALGTNTTREVGKKQKPAVPIKKSIQRDYLICLEDGLQFKSLKRHLMASYGMTPEEYRKRWGLPADYPMVAPAYAETRSRLAKKMGLGQRKEFGS